METPHSSLPEHRREAAGSSGNAELCPLGWGLAAAGHVAMGCHDGMLGKKHYSVFGSGGGCCLFRSNTSRYGEPRRAQGRWDFQTFSYALEQS